MEKSTNNPAKQRLDYGRHPNGFVYGCAYLGVLFMSKLLFHVKSRIDPKIRRLPRPFIVLGNHPSYLDPFLAGCILYPLKINFLAAATFFRNKKLRTPLYLGGIIPKSQFRPDPASIKSMLKVVKRKGILGIFPEGARSIDGTCLPVEDSIAKFIKKVGGSVVLSSSSGSYLTWPRWSTSGFRKGKILVDVRILFTQEEVETLPTQDLQAGIVRALDFDEYAWQEKNRVPFRSKAPARGLHNILHQCPACGKRWVMDTTDTTLFCRSCGNTAVMDLYGFLNPAVAGSVVHKTVRDWNRWQIRDMAASIGTDSFYIEEEADLFIAEGQDKPYHPAGNGTIRLARNGFLFRGNFLGDTVEKAFPMQGILGISSDFGSNFDIVADQYTARFNLKNGQKVISFSHALDLLRGTQTVHPK